MFMKINILRDFIVALCFVLLLLLIGLKLRDDAAKSFTGHYRVVDGDSLTLGKVRFRLLGIDAPEFSQTCMRDGQPWPCGEEARTRLADYFASGEIACRGGMKDKYQRLLVTCFKQDLNINRDMVRLGMAVSFGDYQAEERQAQDGRAGLWASDFVRPIDWRRTHKGEFADEAPTMPPFLQSLFGGSN